MLSPINSQLQEIAKEMEGIYSNGKINEGVLNQTETNINKLLQQKDLPPAVRQKLEAALKDLKNATSSGTVNLGDLFQAKFDISEAEKDLPPQ